MATTVKKKLDFCDKLLRAISEVDRPSAVCTGGDRPLTMPGLEVDGLGPVRLPLGKTQAKQLIKLCRQAPYGKGTQTLVDTDVRRVWEVDAEQIQLTNPKWDELVAEIVTDVQRDLGLESRKLTPHLYKLLLYETGSFFLPHSDGEKLDGMVATLVIGLPSVHKGGALIVSHDGTKHKLALTGAATGYELSYAAFYADCQHEVQPVRSGYRLCLTYNVTLAKTRGKNKQGLMAPDYGTTATEVGELLSDWSQEVSSISSDLPPKMAVTLEHRYTQAGLALDALKGVDRSQAEVLFEAAEQADCVAHLALVTHWESGSAEGGYDEYSNGYHSWSDEDEEDPSTSDHEMGEIFDESLSVNHWSDRDAKKVLLGEIRLENDEIVSATSLDEWETSKEEFEGFTGNAGMTLERWYHRAAIVIWPQAKHFAVLCDAGTDAAIGGLAPMVRRLKRMSKAKREQQRPQCLHFAKAIINSWQIGRASRWDQPKGVDRDVFLPLLIELDDPDLVRHFITRVMVTDGGIPIDKSFAAFLKHHGWSDFATVLSEVIEATSAATMARNAELLRTLCVQRDKNAERINLCKRLADQFVTSLEALDDQKASYDWRIESVDRSKLLASLVRAMLGVSAEKPLSRLIDDTLPRTDKYELTETHLSAIFSLESRLTKLPEPNRAISHWLSECRTELESRTAEAPQKPTDYQRPDKVSCSCVLCRELSVFLADPDERQHRFAVRKDLRRHLHGTINGDRCDLTHVTTRKSSPHTLVCTKTTASYDRALDIHNRDLKNLVRIVKLGKKIGSW